MFFFFFVFVSFNAFLFQQHIRAKLLIPSNEITLSRGSSHNNLDHHDYHQSSASALTSSANGLRAIMPAQHSDSMISSTMSLESLMSDDTTVGDEQQSRTQIANDFAIDITHIEKMVQDTDAVAIMEKRPLDGVQSCLKSLRDQMSNLQVEQEQNVRASTQWRYKLGFTCEKCEMKWY